MAEFKISRIRYTWKNNWTSSTLYVKDDVIRYGGATWICQRQHTATTFAEDQTFLATPTDSAPSPAWFKMTDGYAFKGEWTQPTLYGSGDVVNYGGVLYLCVISHTSSTTFAANDTKWTVYTSIYNWTYDWTISTRYGIGDIVKYNGIIYRCIVEHTSSTLTDGLEIVQSNWAIVYDGIEYVGPWTDGVRYRENDLIQYGGSILRCTTGHYAIYALDNNNWATEFPGFNFHQEWDVTTQYAIGDVVKYGGDIYVSRSNNVGDAPADIGAGAAHWNLLTKAINLRGVWQADQVYKTGDLVRRGGYLYVALADAASDGSSTDYLDASNWEIVVSGDEWKNSWTNETTYSVGDLVVYRGETWRCNVEHIASGENFPSLDGGSGFFYWDLVLSVGARFGLVSRGDLLTYDLSRTLVGDGSTFGPTNVSLGTADQIVSIDENGSVYYKVWGNVDRVRYVSADDSIALDDDTDPDRGINPFKPWRTIRYACERVEALGDTGVRTTIKVGTGLYEEVLPIIVPAGVALRGEELRAVTVRPKPAIDALAVDYTYSIAALTRINAIISNVLNGIAVTPTVGNTLEPAPTTVIRQVGVGFTPPQFDEVTGEQIFDYYIDSPYLLTTSSMVITEIQTLISNIISYINFYVGSSGSDPTMTGSNTAVTTKAYLDTAELLAANKEFLAAEAAAYTSFTYPTYTFDAESCKRDIKAFIDAWIYDIQYTGNYKSLMAARYYRNAVLGSETEDMFYVRNATGIRNMSLKGLTGQLNPPAVNELYRRPTGGAFVSLDPGWGPDDERVWISTRSCYVQNVTTFGENCVGQKIDGSLHNGGNKSIVSNDFTQVISDGIGAWVTNNGRVELVSVFTYYAQIGMFAEAGGIIRATNGNSSYGDYGALADGNDPAETPKYAYVNNRTTQAKILSAFAGEVNDEVLLLEFGNAGQEYTTADYTFIGSGTGATVIQEETRDQAVFELQVRNPPTSPGGFPGGGGYSLIGNNVQTGDATTVTLATSNENTEAELLGLRVIITSGDGTGQYGYLTAYNPLTKVANISRESDGQPGWDHVVSGTPAVSYMTTNATYRFEPRITFAEPPFVAADSTLTVSTTWANVCYGETTATYAGITSTNGSGTTVDVVPFAATWNVTKTGRTYTVTLVEGGAGYADEQTVTIDGSSVGGVSIEHDITITIKSVSNDSTNSILTFEYDGVAQSGKFVITPSTGTSAVASADGDTWEDVVMPVAGNWKCLAAGGNKFVAIQNGSRVAASSSDGITWYERIMPSLRAWNAVTYGDGIFVAVSGNLNSAAFSTNSVSWSASTLPTAGDSTVNEWVGITYGKDKFVAIANSSNIAAVGTYTGSSITWSSTVMDVISDSSQKDWVGVAYGNQRFVTVSSTGDVGYSFDGITWYPAVMPTQDGSTAHAWRAIKYGQGVFFAVGDTGVRNVGNDPTVGPTTFAATSYDGIVWTNRELSEPLSWTAVAFGNPDVTLGDSTASNSRPTWIAVSSDLTNKACKVFTGAKTLGRAIVSAGRIQSVRIWEPGSGYIYGPPSYTIIDPNNTSDAYIKPRTGNGVLAQPSWVARGNNYKTSSTQVTVMGDGYADVIPVAQFVTIGGLETLPGPGTQFRFRGETGYFTVATIERDSTQSDGTFTAVFRIGPYLSSDYDLEHGSAVEIRQRYSQVRITGHDFLDVGSGNFEETNYPALYATEATYFSAPENEIVESNGGRVFYTSTDQSGNFRTGELFSVEQATGTVTISADFFDLQGLTELALGGVRLGGSGAVIREFSTDPLFTADSNNVVPTQKAIKAYLQNRLNVGGSDLLTASFIAGTVKVGPNLIINTADLYVTIPVLANFSGLSSTGQPVNISGSILAQNMFYKSFSSKR